MIDAGDDPMLKLLAYARPLARDRDLVAMRRVLAGIPIDAEAKAARLLEVSYARSLAGAYLDARTAALLAASLAPRSPKLLGELAARLRTFNEAGVLRDVVLAAWTPRDAPIPLLLAFAAQLSYLNRQEDALALLDEAMRADPDYPPTLVSRGQLLTYLGRMDEARASFERCIRRAPEIAQAHWFLAHVGKATAADNHVQRLREQLASPRAQAGERASLAFALHKELDDLGDVEGAWAALQQACSAKRATLKYATEDSRALVDALVAMPAATSGPIPAVDADGPLPIFIVGMHRSGTTLLEQLLDGSPQVRGVGELYDFTSAMRFATDHHCRGVIDGTIVSRAGSADFAEAGRRYLEGMAWRLGGERFFTDKLPSNFLNIGFICRALPQAKILHMARDPVETCFSNLRELFSDANPYSYDQLELADYFLQYRRLMAHWHAAYPGRILDVDYAELTRDPEAVMRKVAAFCGIDYTDAMRDPRSSTRAVATASAVQVRDRVVRREVPKWAPYAKHLQPLIGALRQGGVEIPELPA